jgi:aryl-alcohol dehydrogenase
VKITAAVTEKNDDPFVLEQVELADPGPGEVLIRLAGTGVCHSDGLAVHGDLPFPFPGVLGHEGAGTVAAVGAGVTSVAEGDKVVIGWPSCGQCRNCLDGQPRYCQHIGELLVGGSRRGGESVLKRQDGSPLSSHFFGQSSFATYSLTNANQLVKTPAHLPVETFGPLACGLSTGAGAIFNELRPGIGASLVVYGTGSVGLAAVMAAQCSGATTIIAVDVHESRLALAKELGATHAVNGSEADPVAAVHDICGGPADLSLDCTGNVKVLRQAADSVGMRGTCAIIGGAPHGAEFTLDHLSTMWGKRVVGILGGGGRSNTLISGLIDLHEQGRFPFDRLVQTFPFDQINEALAASYSGEVLKPVITMPADG